MYRTEQRSDFSDQEVSALEGVHPFLDCAVNGVRERETAKTVRGGMAIAVGDEMPGVLILDRNLNLVQANSCARRLCAAWADDAVVATDEIESRAWRLPTDLIAACRELHREWQSIMRSDPLANGLRRCSRVHSRVGGLTTSITMVCPNTADLGEPTFVLELDRRIHGVANDTPDRSAPVLQKMTAAECAVALALADGLSNQDIADRLGKTVDAVKFLLHRIYQKTGVPNRAALVAVLRSRPNRSEKHQRR